MRQTLDVDLTRYCQYLQGATPRTKRAIQAYPSGRAVVILPDGSQHKVQFNTRQSEHVSQTPQAQAALVKFAAMDIDVATLPMRDMTADVQPDQAQGRLHHQVVQPGKKGELASTPHPTMTEQLYALLAENPTLRPTELMRLTGCSDTTASRARRAYFEMHPEQQAASTPTTMTERLYALLAENPTLRPAELMKVVGCDQTLATKARRAYFEAHPEQQAVPQQTATERIHELLAANPALRPAELRKVVGCDQGLAGRVRRAYFEAHPEQQAVPQQTMTERLYALLAENPTLQPVELMRSTGCSETSASRARRAYFEMHPEQQGVEQGQPKGTHEEG